MCGFFGAVSLYGILGGNQWQWRYGKYRFWWQNEVQFKKKLGNVSGKMFFIFTNCNVSWLDNILFRQNFFLCQFCTWQRYVLVHVPKQFMSIGSMIMVKIRDYRRKMSFFFVKWKCYKVLYKFIIKSKDIILKVVQKWNIKLLLHLVISISVKGFFLQILC